MSCYEISCDLVTELYVISFIIQNNIPLNPPIALIYHFIPIGLLSQYTKPHSSIARNRLFYIILLRSAPAIIPLLRNALARHSTTISIPTHQHLICWDPTFLDLISLDLDLFY